MNASAVLYYDSSAFVKLIVPEPESPAVRDLVMRSGRPVSSRFLSVEVLRAVRPYGSAAVEEARRRLGGMFLPALEEATLSQALRSIR